MNISKFTQKSVEAVQGCEKLAYEYGNQQIDQEHLLVSLLRLEDSLIMKLVTKMGISGGQFLNEAEQALNKLPKVSGGGQVYLTNDLKTGGTPHMEFNHELIVVILNEGYADLVMDAARAAGAGGGTVLHAKGTGSKRGEKFFGVSLADEKDMVYIIAYADEKAAIMRAINENAGPGTKAGAICFSLPVSSVAGLRERDEE